MDVVAAYVARSVEKNCTAKEGAECTVDGLPLSIPYTVTFWGGISHSDMASLTIKLTADGHAKVNVAWMAASNKDEMEVYAAYVAGNKEKYYMPKGDAKCTITCLLPRIPYRVCVRACHPHSATATAVPSTFADAQLVSSGYLLEFVANSETGDYTCSKAVCDSTSFSGVVILVMELATSIDPSFTQHLAYLLSTAAEYANNKGGGQLTAMMGKSTLKALLIEEGVNIPLFVLHVPNPQALVCILVSRFWHSDRFVNWFCFSMCYDLNCLILFGKLIPQKCKANVEYANNSRSSRPVARRGELNLHMIAVVCNARVVSEDCFCNQVYSWNMLKGCAPFNLMHRRPFSTSSLFSMLRMGRGSLNVYVHTALMGSNISTSSHRLAIRSCCCLRLRKQGCRL
ncbi:hypothetical protein EmuJ_001149800 [Echinococcus multilocularis]|uniref:Uncharacterized protein n=1 Tax=Echinococcus multilocularis TaxID=6211 RepID=A0A068YNV6_ECHMU|nr:hypothetical protein EmuJ_001149800 [Echinococcus multilocularis]